MLYSKPGFPEESEIVLCTATNVQHNSVFVALDEYQDKSGIIHISEISAGRIRNIREFVREGKKIICKILRVNPERGHIDLSLRRVTESQRRQKNTQLKQEMLAERILGFVAHELKVPLEKLYDQVAPKVFKFYEMVYPCFEDIALGTFDIHQLGLEKKIEERVDAHVKLRIKPPEVSLAGVITIILYNPDGVSVIRDAFAKARHKGVKYSYFGAGKYHVTVTDENYKGAEKTLEEITGMLSKIVLDAKGTFGFDRLAEKKQKSAAV
ncbi:MAG: S1 RNA-binding domain-containing protein [Candidatus Woesearchaeota archaeon]|nr:S1 RNA-binding domain-containing protein [Candidatus Woesearchaeota archaeon]